MDYDDLARTYAAHRAYDPVVLAALRGGARVGPSSRVLEVGCGTGNYVIALHEATRSSSWGVDPSEEMLAIARARSESVQFVLGAAEALPFSDECFDFLFAIDVIHHAADPAASFAEAFRVLRTGGRACVGTDDEASIRARPHSRYFPETVAVELARYPAIADLRSALTAAGFAALTEKRTVSSYRVTESRAYRDRAFSSLHLISQDAHRRGLARLERDLEAGPIEGAARRLLVWAVKP